MVCITWLVPEETEPPSPAADSLRAYLLSFDSDDDDQLTELPF